MKQLLYGFGFVLLLGLPCHTVQADDSLNKLGFDMTWNDEFGGTNVNSSKWNIDDYGTPANNELQYYTPDMVYVENDVLVLKSDRNPVWDGTYDFREFISGKVTGAGRYAQQYGYWEIRAWLPDGNGIWPAHWMLGYNGWPPEIDITEMVGNNPQRMVMSVHWGPVEGDQKPWEIGQTGGGDYWHWEPMTWAYHVFGMEWNTWGVKFYIDGIERASVYNGAPHEPMWMILNTAVGGDWPGYPWGTEFPKYHSIDYVRIWQHTDGRELQDRSFEEAEHHRFPDWNTYGGDHILQDEEESNAHSGAVAVQLFGSFDGATNHSGLYQDVYASEGEMVEGGFWIMNRPDDVLQSNNTVRMKLEFLDSSLVVLDRHEWVVADTNSPDTYTQFRLRGKAPANSERARLVMEFVQRDYAPGAVNVDDASLTYVTPFTHRSLLNAGFETVYGNDFANWKVSGSNILAESAATNVYGGNSSVRFNGSVGSTGEQTLFQDLPTRAGETWNASVYVCNEAGNPLTGTSFGFLRLEFLGSDNQVIASNQLITATPAEPLVVTNLTLQAMAPAESAWARVVLGLDPDGAGSGGVVYDNAVLSPLVTNNTPELINKDFELFDGTNYSSWTRYSAESWNIVNDPHSPNARGGINAPQIFGSFPAGGSNNTQGLFQDLPAGQGQVWEASIWIQNRPGDALQGDNAARLKLEFLDAGKTRIDYDQYSMISAGSPEYYEQAVIRCVAPEDTAYARIVAEMEQVNNADGSVNFDDADLRQLTVLDDRTVASGGFETSEDGRFLNWSDWNNTLPNIIPDTTSTNVLEGDYSAQLFGQFNGGYNESGLFQDVPVAPGEMWLASVWAKNRYGDALSGEKTARLKLEFVDASDESVGTNSLTILDADSPDDEWQYFAIRHLVPDDASRARIVLQLNQNGDAAGSAVFDNAAMRLVTGSDEERSILNGGFEQGIHNEFASWNRYGASGATNVFRDPVSANARSGDVALGMHGSYDGGTNYSGIFQNIPASEGELWEAKVWARNRPGDGIASNNNVELKLEFINEWGGIIQDKILGILDADSTTDYEEFVLRDRAPWGTKLARIVVQINQFDFAPGSVNIDDTELHVITAADGAGLANGGLRDYIGSDFLNWSVYGNAVTNVIRDPQTNALSGSGALQIWGECSSAECFSGMYQGVPAQEGQIWKAKCWARNRPGDGLQGNNQARLKIDYADAWGGIISSHVMPVVDASSSTNYREHALITPAPADCAEIRVVCEMMQKDWAGGSANFDDISLEVLPELVGTQEVERVMLAGALGPGALDTVHFTGDLIFDWSSQLQMDLGGTNNNPRWDRLDVAGSCSLAGSLDINMIQAFPAHIPRASDTLEIIRANNVTGTFNPFTCPSGEGGGDAFSIVTTGTNVTLLTVSELDSDGDGLPDYWEQEYFNSALGASTTLDADGDTLDNFDEYISGTIPTGGSSVFELSSIGPVGEDHVITWPSSAGRVYSVYSSTNLALPNWDAIATNLPATPALNVYTDEVNTAEAVFYKITVRKP